MVKKIFILLITVVALVAIGALVLNVLLPNATTQMVNAVENMIYNATGMSFDFNGDGTGGTAGTASGGDFTSGAINDTSSYTDNSAGGGNVQGFTP